MSRRFADPSLDISIRFSVVRLLISMTTTITATNPSGGVESFTPYANADTTFPDFCNWQAALSVDDDTDPNDWDLALLFTGHDIFRYYLDYNLLGRARIGGACDVDDKCSITENFGLSAGLVMAHETGHSLGLQHDGVYGCTEGLNIMSKVHPGTTGAFEWSSCSSEYMKMFISTQVCMDDISTNSLASILELPGQTNSLDEQCKMVMGNSHAYGCYVDTTCAELYCNLPSNLGSSCYTITAPAEGTPCGHGMWCVNAACVRSSLETSPAVDGGWTEFSDDFSPCSRSCGTGVQYQNRSCTNPTPQWGGAPCVGNSHIYRICNEQPCITSEDDYRNEQCAATNSIPFNGELYHWTDYQPSSILGDELCKKICLTTEETELFQNDHDDRPGNFHDGTLCWYEPVTDVTKSFEFTQSLCLNGRCQQNFGCDGFPDSGLVYDDCHVCNGDGSSCNCLSRTLTSVTTTGESVIVTIPIGSTSISADSYGPNHFIGLRVNGIFIFGVNTTGSPVPTSSGAYRAGNMIVNYDRIFQNETHLRTLTEPSTETLDILLYTTTTNGNNVTYRYCTREIDPCTSFPCQNNGICSASNYVYLCECPDTHEGSNCEKAKSVCGVTECGVKETCNPDTNTCECNGNLVRRSDGQCRRPSTVTLFFAIVIIEDITSFDDIVNNLDSPLAISIIQRITLMLFVIFRRRYGSLFIDVVVNNLRLGSHGNLEMDADCIFDYDTTTAQIIPTPNEVAAVFTHGIANSYALYGITVDPARTVAFDKDECSNSTLNDCSLNAECTNTMGSYDCSCLPGYTDVSPVGSESGTQCEANGLSGGAIAGLAVGSIIILLLLCALVAVRRVKYKRRLATMSATDSLGIMREIRPSVVYGQQRAPYSMMSDHRSDMEGGSMDTPGHSDGSYFSQAYDNHGLIRACLAAEENGSVQGI